MTKNLAEVLSDSEVCHALSLPRTQSCTICWSPTDHDRITVEVHVIGQWGMRMGW